MSPASLRTGLVLASAALLATGMPAQTEPGTDYFTPTAGARELTLGASGATNQDFDDSFGGLNLSLGQYLNATTMVALRQTIDYINPDNAGSGWAASTRVAVDYHFGGNAQFRPFVGANFGGIYGDMVEETWAAGIEAGAKYYVKPQTFIFALVEYSWLFDDADDVEDRFDEGAVFWNVGVGFNF